MKLKELKVMIAQQAVRTIIESKVNEATDTLVGPRGKFSRELTMDTAPDTTIDQMAASDLPSDAVVYHAKKRLHSDSINMKLPDNIRKAAAHIVARQSFEPNEQLDASPVDKKEAIHHLVNFIVEPYSGSKKIKPYLDYLESEQEEQRHEKSDEDDSLRALSGDDLDLVNVDPETGEATKASTGPVVSPSADTVLGRKPRKLKETKSKTKQLNTKHLDEAINNIKSVLKN